LQLHWQNFAQVRHFQVQLKITFGIRR